MILSVEHDAFVSVFFFLLLLKTETFTREKYARYL